MRLIQINVGKEPFCSNAACDQVLHLFCFGSHLIGCSSLYSKDFIVLDSRCHTFVIRVLFTDNVNFPQQKMYSVFVKDDFICDNLNTAL